MSDRIEASDILSEDATAKIKAFNDTIKETATYAANLQKVIQSASKNDLLNSSNIAQHNKDLAEGQKQLNALNSAKLKSEKIALDVAKQLEKEAKAQEAVIKNTNKLAKEQENLNSVYAQTTKRYNELSKAQMELSVRGRENSKVFKGIKQEADALRASLDKAEQGAGRFQRNVGNYKSGFNGLSMSVNQLTREMPAFANSMQTGFMAISNNLPIFFDEISKANKELKALKAQGEQVPSLFKSLASSVFTFGTLLSVGVTLLTVYGKEMVNFVIDIVKGEEAFKTSAENMSTHWGVMKRINDEIIKERVKLKVLNKEWSQQQADEFLLTGEMNEKKIQAEADLQKRLADIRTKYGLDPGFALTGTNRNIPLGMDIIGANIAKKTKEINNAVIHEQQLYYDELRKLEAEHAVKTEVIKKNVEIKAKGEKEKAFKLTDQDKRNIERMEYIEGLKEKAIEIELKGIDAVAEAEKNANQVEVTASDEAIKNHGIDIDNMLSITEKGIAAEKALKDKEAVEDKARMQSTFDFYDSIAKAKQTRLETELDNDIDLRQRNILQQQQLAIAGKDNTLAFEKAAAAKDELRKQELAKKEETRQKRVALFKLIAAYADKGDSDQATSKAFIQMAIAGAIAGSYFEGTENVGEDLKGNKMHNGRDGYHIAVDGSERILTGAQNKLIGDLSNDELAQVARAHNEGVLPKYITDNGIGSFAENLTNSLLIQQFTTMNNKIHSIEKTLKGRPVNSGHRDENGDWIQKQIVNGLIKQTKQKSNSKLNYL
ncbi:MAG: hypothetical protein V4547_18940 [Bacteroidota bacterium]